MHEFLQASVRYMPVRFCVKGEVIVIIIADYKHCFCLCSDEVTYRFKCAVSHPALTTEATVVVDTHFGTKTTPQRSAFFHDEVALGDVSPVIPAC